MASGDFKQLSPVPNYMYGNSGQYCFISSIFQKTFPHHFNFKQVICFGSWTCMMWCGRNINDSIFRQTQKTRLYTEPKQVSNTTSAWKENVFKSLFMSTNGYLRFHISYCFQRYPSCVDNIQSFMLRITFVEKGSNSQTYPFVYPYNRSRRTTEASCNRGFVFTCTNNLNGGVTNWLSILFRDVNRFWSSRQIDADGAFTVEALGYMVQNPAF